jgi:gluconate kinase
MPTPNDDETRPEWMARCIPVLINEGRSQAQAVAICSSMWDDKLLEEVELED